jgi:DNA-directed RNA polymerase subunit M/transcription elongation factor TFIIS
VTDSNGVKEVKETKCTCNACGNVWYYGKQEILENTAAVMNNLSNAACCCSGCLPALLLPNKKIVDLNKCPKCGSHAIEKEEVTHVV